MTGQEKIHLQGRLNALKIRNLATGKIMTADEFAKSRERACARSDRIADLRERIADLEEQLEALLAEDRNEDTPQ